MLRRVRLSVAVRAFRRGEAALLEALAVAREGATDALDLDQIDADLHHSTRVLLEPLGKLRDRRHDAVGLHGPAFDLVGAELARTDEERLHAVLVRADDVVLEIVADHPGEV